MGYDRKIKYLELTEEGIAIQNAGFVKLEARDGEVALRIKVEKLKSTDDGAAQVFIASDEKEAVLGELHLEQGQGNMVFEGMKEEELAGRIAYEDLQEIRIRLQSDRMLRCIIKEAQEEIPVRSMEPGKPYVEEALQQAEIMDGEENAVLRNGMIADTVVKEPKREEVVMILDTHEEEPVVQEMQEPLPELAKEITGNRESTERANPAKAPAASKWQQLWESYPHTRPFDDGREYLELKPEDLVVLTRECYPLVNNSFLLHGYFNYKHLILTKETVRGQEQYYIGAPGNFYTKEKQVAILFGFESFEGKSEPAQNGDFGYYMIPVEI